jgi:hypothetical protein
MTKRFVRMVSAGVVLVILQALLAFLVPPSARVAEAAPAAAIASVAMTAALLAELAVRIRARGAKAAVVLWLVWGGIQANSLAELLLFDVGIPRADVARLALYLLAVSAAFSAFLALAFARKGPEVEGHGGRPAWWRLLLSAPLYVALYFTAGLLVWPYVRAFYEARPMPGPELIVAVQVVRGLVFGSIVLLLMRELRARRTASALLAGLTLGILGGVAPLLVSNPYLPDAVRMAHLPETGISNFLFGVAAGWILARPDARALEAGDSPALVA